MWIVANVIHCSEPKDSHSPESPEAAPVPNNIPPLPSASTFQILDPIVTIASPASSSATPIPESTSDDLLPDRQTSPDLPVILTKDVLVLDNGSRSDGKKATVDNGEAQKIIGEPAMDDQELLAEPRPVAVEKTGVLPGKKKGKPEKAKVSCLLFILR